MKTKKRSRRKRLDPTPVLANGLTTRQQEILNTTRRLTAENARPPTFRELGAATGVASPNGIAGHIKALERKGFLSRRDGWQGLVIAGLCPCCGHTTNRRKP